jgi:prevent-host-death family protein
MAKRNLGVVERPVGYVKAKFAECLRDAEAGATTVVTRHGRPVACLTPYRDSSGERSPPGEVREVEKVYATVSEERFDSVGSRRSALHRLLEEEIRSRVPAGLRGKGISKKEREQILGYRENGV